MGVIIEFPAPSEQQQSETNEFWTRLRVALADELIGKLPSSIPLVDVAKLLRVDDATVLRAIADGSLVTVRAMDGVHMDTQQSAAFIRREWRSRLALPESVRPRGLARAAK